MQIKTLSVVALASSVAVAMPAPLEKAALAVRQWRGGNRWWDRPSSNPSSDSSSGNTVVEYVTTVVGYSDSAPTAAPQAPADNIVVAAVPSSAPAAPARGGAAPAAAAPSAAAASAPETSSGGSGYLAIANKYRVAGGLAPFAQSSQLEANALKTSTASVGGLVHQLNPGTMGQVMAPGNAGNFESVYLGGWLCELPNLPGLSGLCAAASQGWNHAGQTGHAEILTGSYKSIGCAFASSTGVWTCDVA